MSVAEILPSIPVEQPPRLVVVPPAEAQGETDNERFNAEVTRLCYETSQQLRHEDPEAYKTFSTLFTLTQNFVKSTIRKQGVYRPWDVEDVAQETYCAAWRRVGVVWDSDSGSGLAWLKTIARSKARDLRENKTNKALEQTVRIDPDEPLETETIFPAELDPTIESISLRMLLDQAIASLPDNQRKAFVLKVDLSLHDREVAELLELSGGNAAAAVMQRARRAIQNVFEIHDLVEGGYTQLSVEAFTALEGRNLKRALDAARAARDADR